MIKALVIVAHPDDETLWMGGKILHNPTWAWTIISLCRKDDLVRSKRFFSACKKLNAQGFMSGLDDAHPKKSIKNLNEIIKRIKPITENKKFDIVYTHGANGEYGHKRHIEIHTAISEMVDKKLINCKEFFVFNYEPIENGLLAVPKKDGVVFELNQEEFARKKEIIEEIYCFNSDFFEYRSCSNKEAFKRVKVY